MRASPKASPSPKAFPSQKESDERSVQKALQNVAQDSHLAPDLARAATAFIRHLAYERRLSPHSVSAEARDLKIFFLFLQDHLGKSVSIPDMRSLQASDFRSYLARRRAEGIQSRSLARALSTLRGFAKYLSRMGIADLPELAKISAPKISRAIPKALGQEAVAQLLKAAGEGVQPWVAARDRLLLLLLYGAGLRISEALSLKAEDAPFGETLRIKGKGGKERIVPILPAIEAARQHYLRLSPFPPDPQTPLFRSLHGKALQPRYLQKTLARLRVSLGLPKASRRMRCAIVLQPTFSKRGAICARSKNFWAMPPSLQRRSTPTPMPITSSMCMNKPTPARKRGKRGGARKVRVKRSKKICQSLAKRSKSLSYGAPQLSKGERLMSLQSSKKTHRPKKRAPLYALWRALSFAMILLAVSFAFLSAPMTPPLEARMPEGYMDCEGNKRALCTAWWARRSSNQRKWLKAQKMEARNPAVVCMFLLGFPELPNPLLEDCTRRQTANRLSLDFCMAKGHDIMGEETLACKNQWKREHGYDEN